MLLPLQYDFNKHAKVYLFKSHLIQKIKRKQLTSHMKSLVL